MTRSHLSIDFVDDSPSAGGTFNIFAAGDSGIFSSVLMGVKAGRRAASTGTGLQTFGDARALARYIKIETVPANGSAIALSEVRGC